MLSRPEKDGRSKGDFKVFSSFSVKIFYLLILKEGKPIKIFYLFRKVVALTSWIKTSSIIKYVINNYDPLKALYTSISI